MRKIPYFPINLKDSTVLNKAKLITTSSCPIIYLVYLSSPKKFRAFWYIFVFMNFDLKYTSLKFNCPILSPALNG